MKRHRGCRYIEQWGTYREHIPVAHGFTWNASTFGRIALWAGAFPYFIYSVSKAEFQKTDRKYERKEREFL